MGRKFKFKNFFNSFKIGQGTIAIVISLITLWYTYHIDKKNYEASYSEEIQIDVCDDGSDGSISISYDSIHKRAVVHKLLKVDLVNSSNKGITIKKVSWTQERTPFDADTLHLYHEIVWYRWGINKNVNLDRGESKINIDPNSSITVYNKFKFILGNEASSFVKDSLLNNRSQLDTIAFSFEDMLNLRGIPLFSTDNNSERKENYASNSAHYASARIKLRTVNGNYFDKRFSYHCHLEIIDRF